jgi:hypothetical protein
MQVIELPRGRMRRIQDIGVEENIRVGLVHPRRWRFLICVLPTSSPRWKTRNGNDENGRPGTVDMEGEKPMAQGSGGGSAGGEGPKREVGR